MKRRVMGDWLPVGLTPSEGALCSHPDADPEECFTDRD